MDLWMRRFLRSSRPPRGPARLGDRSSEALERLAEATSVGENGIGVWASSTRSRALLSEGEVADRLYRESIALPLWYAPTP